MAGNPFRRAQPDRSAESGGDAPAVNNASGKKKKVEKRVVIQSPPDSPEEELPRRLSAGRVSPPPPTPETHDDDADSDSTATADSDLEEATLNTRRNSGSLPPPIAPEPSASGAPYNPFARTLATSEANYGSQHLEDDQEGAERANGEGAQRAGGAGRPAMDVEAFKNILLTGSAAPSPPVSTSQRTQESSSNTDASSMSKQSMFDPYYDMNPETPRTSFDNVGDYSSASDGDEEGSSLMSGSERLDDLAPPAPPKPSLGKQSAKKGPQTVSFADFEETIPTSPQGQAPSVDTSNSQSSRPQMSPRSPSDLNKPLPAPPQPSHAPERSTQGSQSAPTTDGATQPKKAAPPPPPASRRTGQTGVTQSASKSSSTVKSTPIAAEDSSTPSKPAEPNTKAGAAPPPPPARKSRPFPQSAAPSTETSSEIPSPAPPTTTEAKSSPMPPPPPRRNPSKAGTGTSVNRTPSTASRSSARKENVPPSSSSAPAPPPPRRGNRQSMEVPQSSMASALSNRSNDSDGRRSSGVSVDSGKGSQSQSVAEATEPASPAPTDILADMNALQAEIDALRAKSERG